jgi:hypothetical protein
VALSSARESGRDLIAPIGTELSRRFQIKRATASVGRGDVSANADPLTGYEVLIHGAT